MNRVEFRYYQCLLNPTTGDRVTIALVHWDGSSLRCAHSLKVLPHLPDEQRRLITRALRALEERVKLVNEQGPEQGAAMQEVFRVREGLGSLLFWAELRGALTDAPAAHFAELCALLHFTPAQRRHVRLSTRQLFRELKELGNELAKEAPERVKVNTEIGGLHPQRSPLSWKNGKWHHTVPFSLAGVEDEAEIREAAEQIIGRVRVMFRPGEVPVVLAVLPEDTKLAEAGRREAEILREALKSEHALVLAEPAKGQAYLALLEQTVRHDIAAE
jgi:hypothetical protein